MATRLRPGARTWSLTRDKDGHRDYRVIHVVESATTDGPFNVLLTAGLPLPGAPWLFDGDSDPWAFCLPDANIRPVLEAEPNTVWTVEQTFTTKPPPTSRCQDTPAGDPLTIPPAVGGSFVRVTEERSIDRSGEAMQNSAQENLRGPVVEFDTGGPVVKVDQNVLNLQLPLLAQMIHTVNDAPLWGMAARCVRLSGVSWERKYYGTCHVYYSRNLEFVINYDTFDRVALDEGTMCLRGDWERNTPSLYYGTWKVATDPTTGAPYTGDKPGHYQKFKDWNGENSRVILDGFGRPFSKRINPVTGTILPADDPDSLPGNVHLEYYDESNFLLLGIPATL
jgi:hypothetical protein